MEHIKNILGPKYAIRVGDFRHWHVATATCLCCRRSAEMAGACPAWERPPYTHLVDLQRKLRCTHCGNGEGNSLSARATPAPSGTQTAG